MADFFLFNPYLTIDSWLFPLRQLLLFSDNLYKLFGPRVSKGFGSRSGPTEPFDTLMTLLKVFFEN